MARMPADHIILAEDLQHEVFARRLLIQLGIDRRKIRTLTSPSGRGSGEQFVREEYPRQLRACRSPIRIVAPKLIVLIDADTATVNERHQQLEKTLASTGQDPKSEAEPIAILVPKRNIETWIHFLMSDSEVNEKEAYPKLKREGECRPAALRLATFVRDPAQIPENCPESLRLAVAELRKLLQA